MFWLISCFALVASARARAPTCGISYITKASLDWEVAVPDSWPWHVSVQDMTRRGNHLCGGALISPNWIVTAAHCNVSPRQHVAILGQYNLRSYDDPVQVVSISKVIAHPLFNSLFTKNDIALLKLSSPVKLSKHITPVCVASSRTSLPRNTKCLTAGFDMPGSSSPLRQVSISPLSQEVCEDYRRPLKMSPSILCAKMPNGVEDCQANSGGPLVCHSGGRWGLVGIGTGGPISCTNRIYEYTRVSHLREWIDKTIASN